MHIYAQLFNDNTNTNTNTCVCNAPVLAQHRCMHTHSCLTHQHQHAPGLALNMRVPPLLGFNLTLPPAQPGISIYGQRKFEIFKFEVLAAQDTNTQATSRETQPRTQCYIPAWPSGWPQ